MEVGVATVLVLPLVRPAEVLVCVGAEEEDDEEGEGGCVEGGALGEGRMGREYVRRAGAALEVSFGGAGTRMCGAAAAAALGV